MQTCKPEPFDDVSVAEVRRGGRLHKDRGGRAPPISPTGGVQNLVGGVRTDAVHRACALDGVAPGQDEWHPAERRETYDEGRADRPCASRRDGRPRTAQPSKTPAFAFVVGAHDFMAQELTRRSLPSGTVFGSGHRSRVSDARCDVYSHSADLFLGYSEKRAPLPSRSLRNTHTPICESITPLAIF